jgi:hypothetical protein
MGRTEGDGVKKAIAASLRGQGLHEAWVRNGYAPLALCVPTLTADVLHPRGTHHH